MGVRFAGACLASSLGSLGLTIWRRPRAVELHAIDLCRPRLTDKTTILLGGTDVVDAPSPMPMTVFGAYPV